MKIYQVLSVSESGAALETRELSPTPQGQVTIEVHYSSLNYKDALAVTGKGKIMRSLPMVAGIDAAGVIVESNDPAFSPGDPVLVTGYELSQTHDGGYTEYLQVPVDWVVPLPANLSLFDAMVFGTAGFTAGLAVQRLLDNGQTPALGPVAVTGASGGVGGFAMSILSGLGFEVTAITGKAGQSGEYLRGLGATTILDRTTLVMGDAPLEKGLWGGAVDAVGGELLAWLIRSTRTHGNIAACGLAGGTGINLTVMPFILRGVGLLGVGSSLCPMPLRRRIWQRLTGDFKPADSSRFVTATIPLKEVLPVAGEMLAGRIQGRYVVKVR